MYKIPILFLEDDENLIRMYTEFLDAKGYRSILIRNGQKGLVQAMTEGPSLLTLKAMDITTFSSKRVPVIIITNAKEPIYKKRYEITQAIESSEIFLEIKNSIEEMTLTQRSII